MKSQFEKKIAENLPWCDLDLRNVDCVIGMPSRFHAARVYAEQVRAVDRLIRLLRRALGGSKICWPIYALRWASQIRVAAGTALTPWTRERRSDDRNNRCTGRVIVAVDAVQGDVRHLSAHLVHADVVLGRGCCAGDNWLLNGWRCRWLRLIDFIIRDLIVIRVYQMVQAGAEAAGGRHFDRQIRYSLLFTVEGKNVGH